LLAESFFFFRLDKCFSGTTVLDIFSPQAAYFVGEVFLKHLRLAKVRIILEYSEFEDWSFLQLGFVIVVVREVRPLA
jgi:hypothetical protein